MPPRSSPVKRLLLLALVGASLVGCSSSLTLNEGAPFPSPGRVTYMKKKWNGTRLLICEGGPTDAVCYEQPN